MNPFPSKITHLLWIDWDASSDLPKVFFLCREWGKNNSVVERISMTVPFEISCRFSSENYCIGCFDGEDRASVCGKVLQDGFEQCSSCRSFDSSQICTICRGDCDMPDAHCFVPHVVYLAAYTSSDVKVGVSTAERFRKRITEQGALVGITIAYASNGKVARLLESKIQSECHVPDKVSVRTRLDSFKWNQSLPALKGVLLEARSKVFSSLAPPEGVSFANNGEFLDLLTPYNSMIAGNGEFYPQLLSIGEVRGLAISIKGSDFLLKIRNSFYVLPFKQAIGKILSPMQTNEVPRQTTFSDYFVHQEEV